jgi:hypothetical protein
MIAAVLPAAATVAGCAEKMPVRSGLQAACRRHLPAADLHQRPAHARELLAGVALRRHKGLIACGRVVVDGAALR